MNESNVMTFHEPRPVSDTERDNLRRYLARTDTVPQVAELIRDAPIWRAWTIPEALGYVKTLWADLGGLGRFAITRRPTGVWQVVADPREKHRVQEVLDALAFPGRKDTWTAAKVQRYMDRTRCPGMELQITMMRRNGQEMILDGNHRAVALHELWRRGELADSAVELYLIVMDKERS